MVCRNEEKGNDAVKAVIKASGKHLMDPPVFRRFHCASIPTGHHAVGAPNPKIAGNQDVHLGVCDISSLDSVRSFAAEHERSGKPLHVLVNNAGILVRSFAV